MGGLAKIKVTNNTNWSIIIKMDSGKAVSILTGNEGLGSGNQHLINIDPNEPSRDYLFIRKDAPNVTVTWSSEKFLEHKHKEIEITYDENLKELVLREPTSEESSEKRKRSFFRKLTGQDSIFSRPEQAGGSLSNNLLAGETETEIHDVAVDMPLNPGTSELVDNHNSLQQAELGPSDPTVHLGLSQKTVARDGGYGCAPSAIQHGDAMKPRGEDCENVGQGGKEQVESRSKERSRSKEG